MGSRHKGMHHLQEQAIHDFYDDDNYDEDDPGVTK